MEKKTNKFLRYLPALIAAALIFVVYYFGDILLTNLAAGECNPYIISLLEGVRRLLLMFGCFFIACGVEALNLAKFTDVKTVIAYTARDWMLPAVLTFNILFSGATTQGLPQYIFCAIIILVIGQISIYCRSEEDGNPVFGYICSIIGAIGVLAIKILVPIISALNMLKAGGITGVGFTSTMLNRGSVYLNKGLPVYDNTTFDNIAFLALRFIIPTIILLIFLLVTVKKQKEFPDKVYATVASKLSQEELKDLQSKD